MAEEIKVIPNELKSIVLDKTRQGFTAEEIIVILKEQFDVQLGIRTMTRFLKNTREMRQEVAKEQYALAVADNAHKDLHTIDVVLAELNVQFMEELNNKKTYQALGCARIILDYVKFRASLSGILNNIDNTTNTNTTEVKVVQASPEDMKRQTEDIVAGLLEKLGR